jgi:hypothetical protein
MATTTNAFDEFEQKYSAQVTKGMTYFAKNASLEQAKPLKLKNYQKMIENVSKGKVMYGFSLQIKETARKTISKSEFAGKSGFPAHYTGREMVILAIATFGYVHIALNQKKQDVQVQKFLEAQGPFALEDCMAVIREVVPELTAPKPKK